MSAKKARILIVDDEPAMRAMAKAMLEAMEFETVLADSGEQAIDLYHQSLLSEEDEITMAIMDLTLPGGMSGVEALQELQDMDRDLPVVATSGYLEENAYEICQQIGFVGVLPKPYTAEKLKHLVNWVVSRKGIPGGYSEGMPRPEAKPAKKESDEGLVERPTGDREMAELNVQASVGQKAASLDDDRGRGLELEEAVRRPITGNLENNGAVDYPARSTRAGSNFEGNGIADRLSDLVEIAVSHRGGGEDHENGEIR